MQSLLERTKLCSYCKTGKTNAAIITKLAEIVGPLYGQDALGACSSSRRKHRLASCSALGKRRFWRRSEFDHFNFNQVYSRLASSI